MTVINDQTCGWLNALPKRNNINQLSNSDLRLDYHGISPQWINLRNEKSGSNLVTTKGKNEMLTVLNALQQYIMQVEGKQFR